METLHTTGKQSRELSRDEAMMVVGGNDIINYLKCVNATLSKGGGGLRTAMLGTTLFGMARLFGVMVGCSSL
ncbi:MAG: hypothetical protein JNK79_00375 [Chitinophagaceae bacterium]|nr:hypothetical protein [Chitinophagaceae bacterium]